MVRATSRKPVRQPWRWVAPAAVVLLIGAAVPAQANHSQSGTTFDSLGGNEWWVDVQMGGAATHWGAPEVRDSDGAWSQMSQPSWAGPGRYVASYHVEPGHLVKFRVSYKSEVLVSCWFTHPAGNEACDGSETFTASFAPSGTSEQVRVRVDSSQPAAGVSWRIMGNQRAWSGPEMTRVGTTASTTSSWVSNLHVPDGAVLKFMAHSNDDWSSSVESGCYRWPAATPVACPPSEYLSVQPPVSYDGSQAHMENQVYVSASDGTPIPLQRMEVRFNGGTFNAMRLDRTDPSGSYSHHRFDEAPTTRSVAQYRAVASDGHTLCEDTAYFWPPAGFPDRYNTGETIQFTNVQGTTGWVQTNLYSSKPVVAVEAQVNGGAWKALQKQSWCDWATAMDAPAGTVVLRGYFPDLTSWTSEPFSWNPSGGSTFGAQFSQVAGNQWWEQAKVDAFGGTLANVDVRVNGGAWKPLAKQSWGANMWAGSHQAVDGSAVQFQATGSAGAKVVSACYRWLPSSPPQTVTCPIAPPPPPPSGFDATFTGVKGNDWWVQASVSANAPLAGVDARIDCGATWKPLAKQSWGGWAASFNIPAGSKVDFRARGTDGASDLSGGYVWPQATPAAAC